MRLLERELQLDALHEYVADARAGDGRLVLVCGEAGIGKSSLVDALLAQVEDARVAWTACDGAFTPSALGPLQDVADQWGGAVRVACADGVPRDARFAALLSMLREHDGLSVLVVEDLHFADEATLDLVGHLARRLRGVRALVVATYRDDGLAENRSLRETLGEASSQRSTRRIALPPLTPAAVDDAQPRHRSRAGRGVRAHGGNPFFVCEVLRAGRRRAPGLGPGRRAGACRAAVRAGRAVLDAAALFGERVEPDCWPRSRRRRRVVAGRAGRRRDSWRPTDGRSGSGTRSPGGRSSTRSDRTPLPSCTGGSWPRCSRRGRGRRRPAGAPRGGRPRRGRRRSGTPAAPATARPRWPHGARRSASTAARCGSSPATSRWCGPTCSTGSATQLATLDQFGPAAEALEESVALWRAGAFRSGRAMRSVACPSPTTGCAAEPRSARRSSGALASWSPSARPASWPGRCRGPRAVHGRQRDGHVLRVRPRAQAMAASLDLPDVAQRRAQHPGVRRVPRRASGSTGCGRPLDIGRRARAPRPDRPRLREPAAMLVDAMRYAEAERFYREGMAYCDEHDTTRPACASRGGQAQVLMLTGRWADGRGDRGGTARAATGPRPSTGSPSSCPWACSGPGGVSRACGSCLDEGPPPPPWRPAAVVRRHAAEPRAPRRAGWRASRTRSWLSWSWPPGTPRECSVRAAQRRPGPLPDDRRASGPRPRTCPAPYAAELRGDVREAAAPWDAAGPRVRRRDGAARLARRGRPARGARPVRGAGRRAGGRDGAPQAPRGRRPRRTRRGSSRDARAPGRADGARAGGARPARPRGSATPRSPPAWCSRRAPCTTTSPPCWPSSAWPTAARRLPT